ncbi:FlhC family transcriptional regulator [Enterobacter sp. Bisph1]|uniref:FlhC family transcriptional regulator n=1 Tax=Enterobacter sp. Bisph1 TaxID=1274399 RepID=UPI0018CF3F34|nr:FlhC family transcriptional regulator [Enterobacter sp. Bisph1]
MNKNYISEVQKVALALFLANRGVCNIFADHQGDKPTDDCAPFTKAWFTNQIHRVHARHFGQIWRLLKIPRPEMTSHTVIDVYSLYVSDCLLELQSPPVLSLVQGWVLIEAYEKCHICTDGCEPGCCFGEQLVPSLIERYIYRLCIEPELELQSGLLKNACSAHYNNASFFHHI